MRWSIRRQREALQRDADAVAAAQALLAATRRGSAAVLSALEIQLRTMDAEVDAMLVFVPDGPDLRCIHAGGARTAYHLDLRLRGDDPGSLPPKAALLGCRTRFPHDGPAVLPADRWAVAVPMRDDATTLAVAYLASSRRAPARVESLVGAIELAALPYAVALEREVACADATYDGLTGLLAPRAFRRELRRAVASAGTTDASLGVWFVDTDRFKRINDTYGHRTGDRVLQALAALLERHLQPGIDAAGRNGGDEFCALLRACGKDRTIARAVTLCGAVAANDFGVPGGVSVSIGIAAYPRDAQAWTELLEAADGAMYVAKRSGGNRVAFVQAGEVRSIMPEAEPQASRTT